MAIGTLAEKLGLSVSALRKYENEGLLLAHRTASGHRLFSQEDADRVRNIHRLIRDLGLNIEGIRRLQAFLPCWDLIRCGAEASRGCAAFREPARPCWTVRGVDCAPKGNECRNCLAYRFGTLCTEEIRPLMRTRFRWKRAEAILGDRLEKARER